MTSKDQRHPGPSRRKPLAWALVIAFVLSMVMGTGPGVLIVNRPETAFGIPLVYAWGVMWYLVQVAVALVAYFVLWRAASDDEPEALPELEEGDRQ